MLSLCRESARYISTEDLSLWPNTAFTIGLLSVVLLGTVSNHTSQALGQISNWAKMQYKITGPVHLASCLLKYFVICSKK